MLFMKKEIIIIGIIFLVIGIIIGIFISSNKSPKSNQELLDCRNELKNFENCGLSAISNVCYKQGFSSEKMTIKKTGITDMISYDRNSCLEEYRQEYKSNAKFCIVEDISQSGEIVCRCWA